MSYRRAYTNREEIPVTPVEYLEQIQQPYVESYPPMMTATAAAPVAPATPVPLMATFSAESATANELKQIKFLLIGVAVLILLLLVLRRWKLFA